MRKYLLIGALALVPFIGYGQNFPKLKPLKEKKLGTEIHPAEKKGKWGFADEKGHFLIKPLFDRTEDFELVMIDGTDTVWLAPVLFEGRYGILNRNGTYQVEPCYDE